MPPLIEVQGVTHAYTADGDRHAPALRGIDLAVEAGEFVALVGPNGSGKSTLARHLNGLLLPTTGDVRVNGLSTADPHHLCAVRQQVGMVFQNPDNQIVAGTVEEDVAFGPENLALPPAEIRQRVDAALDAVGLAGYRTHPPHTLSGGQKQLLAIAGVLASQPACLVLDEPTAMLDPSGRQRVLDTLHRLNREAGAAVILITQDMEEAATARRVLVMDTGRIVMDGPPTVVFDDAARLYAIGVAPPVAVEIAWRLRERGIPLPPGLLTVAELARALC